MTPARPCRNCRVCGSSWLRPVIDLGEQWLQGAFVKPGRRPPPDRRWPLRLVRCDTARGGCGLLQLAISIAPEALYGDYWYRSGTNATMRDHLRGIARAAMALCPAGRPAVLDIGCNDGTLLSCFPDAACRVGVDPSQAAAVDDGAMLIRAAFPDAPQLADLPAAGFDVVTSIAMFYDLEDPVAAAAAIARLLRPGGVWILELSYLPLMLVQNAFDTICFEHLEYYSLRVLDHIAARADLRIFRAELNDSNGGSIRCYVCHAGEGGHGSAGDDAFLQALRRCEAALALDTDAPYAAFQSRAGALRRDLMRLLAEVRAEGGTVHVYGASTKGNVLLQWCGIGRDIVACAADRNPEKVGACTLGTGIPIVSEEQSRALRPDWYLVLPWHFRREFLARERAMVAAGTRLLFPLPRIEVIDASTVAAAAAAPPPDPLSLLGLSATG
ncbi:MAG TPA: class I SAM-dependent methyltransferase [Azospirillaceae bacterium]|nr:class I SAM-dependent methyltransferase [Azospirillaceae bacterium]